MDIVTIVDDMGWVGKDNEGLLKLAGKVVVEILVTADKSTQHQHVGWVEERNPAF